MLDACCAPRTHHVITILLGGVGVCFQIGVTPTQCVDRELLHLAVLPLKVRAQLATIAAVQLLPQCVFGACVMMLAGCILHAVILAVVVCVCVCCWCCVMLAAANSWQAQWLLLMPRGERGGTLWLLWLCCCAGLELGVGLREPRQPHMSWMGRGRRYALGFPTGKLFGTTAGKWAGELLYRCMYAPAQAL